MSGSTSNGSRLASLLAGGTAPAIAVPFTDQPTDDELDRLVADGLDVAELRIDRFSSYDAAHVVAQARRFRALPTIATIRVTDEGGEWSGSDAHRLELFRAVMPEVDGVDVELSSVGILTDVVREAHQLDKLVIVSIHDFEATPSFATLEMIAQDANEHGADIVKVAAMAPSPDDLRTLARFTLAHPELALIVIAMGTYGSVSRVFFPSLGSRLTYAFVSHPVPGQLTFEETVEMFRRFYPEAAEENGSGSPDAI